MWVCCLYCMVAILEPIFKKVKNRVQVDFLRTELWQEFLRIGVCGFSSFTVYI